MRKKLKDWRKGIEENGGNRNSRGRENIKSCARRRRRKRTIIGRERPRSENKMWEVINRGRRKTKNGAGRNEKDTIWNC